MRRQAAGTPKLSELLAHKPYRQYVTATFITNAGSSLTPVAIAVGVTRSLHSASSLGLVLAAYSVPQIIFLLVGGVWADRLSRRSLMMFSDAVRGFAQAALGLGLLTGAMSLWLVMLLQFICGGATALFLPAATGFRLEAAPPGMLQEANAVNGLIRTTSGVVGPLIAGLFLLLGGSGWLLLVDSATFFISWQCLSRIRLPAPNRPRAADERRSFVIDLSQGWRAVAAESWIWSSIGCFMIFNLCFSAILVLGPSSLVGSADGSALWGAVMAALSAGQIAGNAAAARLHPRYPLLTGRYVLLLSTPLMVLFAVGASPYLLICGAVLCGFAVSYPDVLWETSLQRQVDERALSRISSYDYVGSNVLRPLGLALFGVVSGRVGDRDLLLAAAVVVIAATSLSLLNRTLRSVVVTNVPVNASGP
jgi:predicted MFS family arabinose efflux permease